MYTHIREAIAKQETAGLLNIEGGLNISERFFFFFLVELFKIIDLGWHKRSIGIPEVFLPGKLSWQDEGLGEAALAAFGKIQNSTERPQQP